MKSKKILVNRAKCNYCESVIESQSRHHLNICECGKFFVDGGIDYLLFALSRYFIIIADKQEYLWQFGGAKN